MGKTSTARILARCLNCVAGPTAQPCGTCDPCREIMRGNCLDVVEIDGASNTGVDDIREIKNDVLYPPGSTRYKVFIIDEVHMLSQSAFNALLKTIEEPPPYIVFIFATTEVQKLPATVCSRCQQFHFRLIELDELRRLLREVCQEGSIEAQDEALHWIAREAGGSLRDAYTLLDQVVSLCQGGPLNLHDIQQKLGHTSIETLTTLFELLVDGEFSRALEAVAELLLSGIPVDQLCVDLADYLHALLLLQAGVERGQLLGHAPPYYSSKVRQEWHSEQLRYALERCFALYQRLRTSLNARFELELFLNELAELKRWLSPQQLVAQLQQLRRELGLEAGELSTHSPTPATAPSKSGRAPEVSRRRPEEESLSAPSHSAAQERAKAAALAPKSPPQKAPPSTERPSTEPPSTDPNPKDTPPQQTKEAGSLGIWNEACWHRVIHACRPRHALLADILARSGAEWQNGTLQLITRSNYDHSMLEREQRLVLELVSAISSAVRSLTLRRPEKSEIQPRQIDDPQLKMLGDVFRGNIEEDT